MSDETTPTVDETAADTATQDDTAQQNDTAQQADTAAPVESAPPVETTQVDTASSGETDSSGIITGKVHNANRKVREGLVVSNSMDKTAVVVARDRVQHRRYNKTVQRDKRLYVHDEDNDLNVGDRVRVVETRPLSKNKRWRLLEILERAR